MCLRVGLAGGAIQRCVHTCYMDLACGFTHLSQCGKQTCVATCNVASLGLMLAGCLSAVGSGVCRPVLTWAGLDCPVLADGSHPQGHPDSAASGHSRFHLFPAPNPHGSSWSPRLCVAPPPSSHLPSPTAHRPPAHWPPCCALKLPNRFWPQGICTCYAHWPGCSPLPSSPSLRPQNNGLA